MKKESNTFADDVGGFESVSCLWCVMYHIYDYYEGLIVDINGTEITEKDLNYFGSFVEFKEEFCGYDYMHHRYFKAPYPDFKMPYLTCCECEFFKPVEKNNGTCEKIKYRRRANDIVHERFFPKKYDSICKMFVQKGENI